MEGLQKVYVNSISMITPVGVNATMTIAAVRAGINVYQESSILGKYFEPLKVAAVPIPDDRLALPDIPAGHVLYQQRRTQRMLRLAIVALNEILSNCVREPLPLFLAAPEAYPYPSIDGHFLKLLSNAIPSRLDVQSSRLIATGRAGGLQALQLAFQYLNQTGAPHVLIGGVDSLIDLAAMGTWDSEDRISSLNTTDGFAPGEGAAFLLLSSQANQNTLGTTRLPGVASEPGHRYSDKPYLGEGMANAFKQALHEYRGPAIETIFSSINGESLGAKEHGVAFTRSHRYFSSSYSVEHPADCFGDLGAAMGPALLALAVGGIKSGHVRGPAIVCCAADQETRAACIVAATKAQ